MTNSRRNTVRRRLAALSLSAGMAAVLVFAAAGPASAFEPVGVVHTEVVTAGPYEVTVGFSTWPVRAMQSLDFTFAPKGGIADKSGRFTLTGPAVDEDHHDAELARHPRKLDVWGLDITALSAPGEYAMEFVIDGAEGSATGRLDSLTVLDQPGPPLALSWAAASLPFLALVVLIAVSWHRTRPGRRPLRL